MTSHELRNPLSAVVQCTEMVLESLQQISLHAQSMLVANPNEAKTSSEKLQEEVRLSLESMRTIDACSGHSQRIIGDILTLSKLDAKLLEIVPIPVRFTEAINACIDLFRRVAQAKDLQLELELDHTLHQLGVEWVTIDSSRVQQIIINMLTNAIKVSYTPHTNQEL